MRMLRIARTLEFGDWCRSGSPDPGRHDISRLVMGASRREFLKSFAGREPIVAHGSRERFASLLGSALVRRTSELSRVVGGYSQRIRRVVYDNRGVLRYETVRPEDLPGLTQERSACFFLDDYDGHFRGPQILLNLVCSELGYARLGASCRGSFHNPGALVTRHCDSVDVLVLQLFGVRQWRLEPNVDPPVGIADPVRLPNRLRNGWSATFGLRSEVVTLRPGSTIYVPRGWWHETRSSVCSLAITMGMVPI